jgi:hypothetical protein
MIPAWIVYSWPPVLWQALGVPLFNFGHLGTRVLSVGNAHNPCSGQTVWGRASDEGAAGVAWDWVQLQEGVVAMADPMGLIPICASSMSTATHYPRSAPACI